MDWSITKSEGKKEHQCYENQLGALFILSLFRQSTSTCFRHIYSPSPGGMLYIYIYIYIYTHTHNSWYVLCFLGDSQLKSTTRINCCICTVYGKRKANWIGHILRRNCLLQRVTEGKIQGGIEVTGRQGRRRIKLLDDLKEREDTLIWKRKLWIALCGELALEEALDLS